MARQTASPTPAPRRPGRSVVVLVSMVAVGAGLGIAPRWNTSKIRSRQAGATPGPRSRTASTSAVGLRRTRISIGVSGGVWLSALSTRLSSNWVSSRASQRSSGRPGSSLARKTRPGACWRARRNTVPTSSSADSQSSCNCTPGASSLASCRVLLVSLARWPVSCTMRWARRWRCALSIRSPWSCSDDAAPRMVASGVR